MSDVYVIRRRKAGGGWEYLQSDHVDDFWGGFATSRRTFDRPVCTWNGQLCRMVPTVTWAWKRGQPGTWRWIEMSEEEARLCKRDVPGSRIRSRTTWRVVPESEL